MSSAKKHIDADDGHSYVLWLGDYVGGELLFEDGTRLEDKYTWHKMGGYRIGIYHMRELNTQLYCISGLVSIPSSK